MDVVELWHLSIDKSKGDQERGVLDIGQACYRSCPLWGIAVRRTNFNCVGHPRATLSSLCTEGSGVVLRLVLQQVGLVVGVRRSTWFVFLLAGVQICIGVICPRKGVLAGCNCVSLGEGKWRVAGHLVAALVCQLQSFWQVFIRIWRRIGASSRRRIKSF